ncbi:DNA alkylation repair protein [Rhizobiales bacterium]|uniref:DNA alkylation repair protein n=1 Tax=Hongsoonwoonella zoysiae TaxID=2821844 RepID=UPI001560B884|nr:DNA alkylation repair protein [Hongsoonwoonella zoysiae]NRG16782.1 DNA alkylation repair protein [Hongsoonwoonella zoysiae]
MAEPLKNIFSPELVRSMASVFSNRWNSFDAEGFATETLDGFEELELKQRSQRITRTLACHLPEDFPHAAEIVLDCLGPVLSEVDFDARSDGRGLTGWATLPLADYVAEKGTAHFETTMLLLKELTMRCSAEFAIRPVLLRAPEKTLEVLHDWTDHPNQHVRRLVSEGTRPRLPWAPKLPQFIADPAPVMELLEKLKDDKEEYVRRSVANNLNDISKDHPDKIAQTAKRWLEGAGKNRARLVRHACRTLIKKGHPETLAALGFGPARVRADFLSVSQSVEFGSDLEFEAEIVSTSPEPQKLVIDYVIHHRKANGGTSPKVFKWRNVMLEGGGSIRLFKRHGMREITTRKYYAGGHAIDIQVNGEIIATRPFTLKMPLVADPSGKGRQAPDRQ